MSWRARYLVRLGKDDTRFEKEVGAIVLASEPALEPDFEGWGVPESNRVRSLSWFEDAIEGEIQEDLSKVVFLCGFTHHSNPFSQERAVRQALALASKDQSQVLFITEHFKVAHMGMERLTRQAREAGVLFVKMTETRPVLEAGDDKNSDDKNRVSYYDESMGMEVAISPQIVVLEESYRPSPGTDILAERLGVHLDPQGFFQGENIHNLPIASNRVGILVVGPAKGPVSFEEGMADAKAAALAIHNLLDKGKRVIAENRIVLDKKKCTICLTCYRLCPHRAISYLNRRPVFSDLACQVCGICAAECPMDAIQIHGFTDLQIKTEIGEILHGDALGADGAPGIVAFCCQNSAVEAADLAAKRGLPLSSSLKILKVPCAGRVDVDYLLTAFRAGADGVMVLGCHHGSCKSVQGSDLAEYRVKSIQEALGEAGIEGNRLFFGGLAPGSSAEFVRMVQSMEETLRNLGNSPIKSSGAGK
ncbi:MAG: hydrogenase iron-sulfur subunit [Deltaproteobacteria bacterium]|nr:hydrogenase iron-sulfur subunit [Deltaproteobacteria bacterium]